MPMIDVSHPQVPLALQHFVISKVHAGHCEATQPPAPPVFAAPPVVAPPVPAPPVPGKPPVAPLGAQPFATFV
jgi:hypothetical protein